MILYNLQHAAVSQTFRARSSAALPVGTWPSDLPSPFSVSIKTVPALRPSPAFNKQQLLPIFEDFVQRQEYLWDDDVRHCVVAGRARLLRS